MVIASIELQKAIYSALKNGSYSVFEIAPPNIAFPYITIGEETLTTDDTKTNKRTVHNVTIHTWSEGSSSAEIKVMNHFVLTTILNNLKVNGFYLDMVSLELQTTIKEQDSDSTIFHGVLQFEITLTKKWGI